VHAVENRKLPNLLLLPLMTLWANLHGSFTFGLAIGAVLAAEAIIESQTDLRFTTARRWGVFLLAALAFACITPYGYRPVLMTFNLLVGPAADNLHFIQEWRPVAFQMLGINELILFGLLFLALYHGAKVRFCRLILTLALIYLMFVHVRFAGLFAITAPLLLATPLAEQFPFLRLTEQFKNEPQLFDAMSRYSKRFVFPACVLVAGGMTIFGIYGPFVAPVSSITPAGAVDYVLRHNLVGNIYNPYDFGGYLIFRRIKTFIDGRSGQLFNDGGFMARLYSIVEKHPKLYPSYLDEYNISLALVRPDSIEAQELERSTGWERVYSDSVGELFQRKIP
jgi:hypothetical protein